MNLIKDKFFGLTLLNARSSLFNIIEDIVHTLSGEQLDEIILDITNIASNVTQQMFVNVMNKSDFFGKQSTIKVDFFLN